MMKHFMFKMALRVYQIQNSVHMVGWLSEFFWHKVQEGHAAPDKKG